MTYLFRICFNLLSIPLPPFVMNRLFLLIIPIFLTALNVSGQNKHAFDLDYKNPNSVVSAIFYAANTQDFAILQYLCDPLGRGDGDTKYLCGIATLAIQARRGDENDEAAKKIAEFITVFKAGEINGEVTYQESNGIESAKVPFLFDHKNRKGGRQETMNLVKRYGNWYLTSF